MKILDEAKNAIEVDGIVYEAAHEGKACSGCTFLSVAFECKCVEAPCFAAMRPDHLPVIFKTRATQAKI